MTPELWGDIKEFVGAALIVIVTLSFAALLCGLAYNVIMKAGCSCC